MSILTDAGGGGGGGEANKDGSKKNRAFLPIYGSLREDAEDEIKGTKIGNPGLLKLFYMQESQYCLF
jgi:hypothetical protein